MMQFIKESKLFTALEKEFDLLEMYGKELTASKCECGSITIKNIEIGFVNSMSAYTFRCLFIRKDRRFQNENGNNVNFEIIWEEKTSFCDHCINNIGIDLCGCGSGKRKGRCKEGHFECRNLIPSQEIFYIQNEEEDDEYV